MDPSLRVLIEQAEFRESFRGYDRAQVDDMLERLATQAGKLESQVADVESQVEARVQAELAARGTTGDPALDEEKSAEEVRLTLVMAQRTADAAIKEARTKADELLAAARESADKTTADARAESTRERQKSRKDLAEEVKSLEGVRTSLQTDIDALDDHVKRQREQLIGSLDQLRKVLDDPTALRTEPSPEWTAVVPEDASSEEEEQPQEAAGASPDADESNDKSNDNQPADAGRGQTARASEPTVAGSTASNRRDRPPPAAVQAKPDAGTSPKPIPSPGQPAATFDSDTVVDHADPGVIDPGVGNAGEQVGSAGGEPTAPVASVDVASEEDGFLAELRKAMTDEDPLGPRDPAATRVVDQPNPQWSPAQDAAGGGRPKSRFGRKR